MAPAPVPSTKKQEQNSFKRLNFLVLKGFF